MNPRRLDGGSQELGELIRNSLQGAFPGVEFSLEPLDQTEFGVYWRYKAPGAPSEKDVRVYMALHWPSIDAKLRDSDGQALAGKANGMAEPGLRQMPPRKPTGKTCKFCGAENRKSNKGCTQCGTAFPCCVVCEYMLQDGDKYCPRCGLVRTSYA